MRNRRLFYISHHTLYRTIMLNPRVLSSMSGIARFPGSAYKHMNRVLRDICDQRCVFTAWQTVSSPDESDRTGKLHVFTGLAEGVQSRRI